MANHKSAEKRIRRNTNRAAINRNHVSRIRTYIKKVELCLEAGNKSEATTALSVAIPEIHSGVSKGVFHKNMASRKISRLTKRVNALA